MGSAQVGRAASAKCGCGVEQSSPEPFHLLLLLLLLPLLLHAAPAAALLRVTPTSDQLLCARHPDALPAPAPLCAIAIVSSQTDLAGAISTSVSTPCAGFVFASTPAWQASNAPSTFAALGCLAEATKQPAVRGEWEGARRGKPREG
jgi:hypothetical protein